MNRFSLLILLFALIITSCNSSGPVVEFDDLEAVYAYTDQQATSHMETVRATTGDPNESELRTASMAEKFCDCASKIDLAYFTNNENFAFELAEAQQALSQEKMNPAQEKMIAYYATQVLCSEMLEYGRIKGTHAGQKQRTTLNISQMREYPEIVASLCPESKQLMEDYMSLAEKREKELFQRQMDALKNLQKGQ